MKRAKFEKLMDRAGELPTLPVVAQRVLELVQDDKSDARLLKEIIECDPVICARLLQLANSAYYRYASSAEVADVQRAIMVLGFVNIRNIVLATCLRSLYSPEFRTNHFTARDLWMHSVAVAVISRILAEETSPEHAEEAFMSGLLHDVGMIVEWNLFPDLFPRVLQRYQGTGTDFLTAENEALGFDHCAVASTILRKWKLPKTIRLAAARHHKPNDRGGDESFLPAIVHAAERICSLRGDGFFDMMRNDEEAHQALAALGLPTDAYGMLIERVAEELEKARDLLAL